MKRCISIYGVLLLAASCAFASIDGTVVNRTTQKPQAGVNVTLVKPGQQGMQTIGSVVSDASGRFVFENDRPGGGPQLLQANYKGVNYNKLMTPDVSTSNVELDVYEATKSAAVARIAQQMIIFEPSANDLNVSQAAVVQNDTNTTFSNDGLGGLRFYLPPEAKGQVQVNVKGPGGMPLPRPAERTEQNQIFKVNFPIKPGETEFDVSYALPVGSPFVFRGRQVSVTGMSAGPLRLVAPAGVTLAGSDIQKVGVEPKTQAAIYSVVAPGDFSVEVSGAVPTADDSDTPQPVPGRPKIYQHLRWLVVLAFAVLGTGLIVLFRNSSPGRLPDAPSHRS